MARMGVIGLFVLFFVFFRIDAVMDAFMGLIDIVLKWFGLPWESTWRQYKIAFFGVSE